MLASIRHATSSCSLNTLVYALRTVAVTVSAGASGKAVSRWCNFLSAFRTILRLRYQSIKLLPFSFSFSRIDLMVELLTDCVTFDDIYKINKVCLVSLI